MRICFDKPEVEIAELQIFGPAPEAIPETAALPNLPAVLRENGIGSLYSDRWVANQVHRTTRGGVRTAIEPGIFPDCDTVLPSQLRLTADCALLVRNEDAGTTEQCLADRDIAMRRTEVGPWILFDFAPDRWQDKHASPLGLEWTGFGVMQANTKEWSRTLIQRAEAAHAEQGDRTKAIALLQKALRVYENYRPARRKLAEWLAEAGRTDEARRADAEAAAVWKPDVAAPIAFKNGVCLLGLDLPETPVAPGQSFEVRYYWKCPPEVDTDRLAVFAHFKNGGRLFQDDHVLLDGLPVSYQPYPDEVFVEKRTVTVPEGTPTGNYAIEIGVHDRAPPAERLRPGTELPSRKRAVTLPVSIAVS